MKFAAGSWANYFSLGRKSLGFLALICVVAVAQAGPLEDLRAPAQLSGVELPKLKSGEIYCQRVPLGSFPRGIALESCYFIHAPLDVVGNRLLHWDPIQHRDLDVRLYQEYSFPASPNTFRRLQLSSSFSGDKWLLDQIARVTQTGEPGELHLTGEEAASVRQNPLPPNDAWQQILQRRSEALARGGLAAVPPYEKNKSVSPESELRGVLSQVPKAARYFQPVLGAQPFVAKGSATSETVGYWEATKIRDHTTLQLGFFSARKSPGSWQLADCTYYPTDTYYMALDLFQLWPTDGGTLVWQVGLASAPFRSYLGGVDRYFAGRIMTDDTIGTIKAFRSDLEKSR